MIKKTIKKNNDKDRINKFNVLSDNWYDLCDWLVTVLLQNKLHFIFIYSQSYNK